MRKTLVLLVCIGMYPYVSRMYPCVSRMYPYVTRMLVVCWSYVSRMYSYVSVCSVCYSYVTRMYLCGVLVMIRCYGYLKIF